MQIHASEKIISGRLQKKLIAMVQSQGRISRVRGRETCFSFFCIISVSSHVCRLSTKYFKQKCSKVNILKLVSKENAF